MAYTPPNVFVNATAVSATSLQANYDALRRYINRDIIQADIAADSVTTTDLVRGEYANVTRDHQFMTGDVYTLFNEIDIYGSDYLTSHFKSYDLLDTKLQQIPNCGKRVVMEHDGHIVFTVSVASIGDENYELSAEKFRNPQFLRISKNDRVLVTDIISASKGHAFTEDNVSTDTDNSGFTFNKGYGVRRWYCQRYVIAAQGGEVVNFCLTHDPRCDKMHVTARNVNVEVFYR
jgi:hypothetical protein